jgi:Polyketide cyclase / dehydrase and lipid transport
LIKKLLITIVFVPFALAAIAAAFVIRPTDAPDYAGAPPALAQSGHVSFTIEAIMPMPPEEFRAWQRENPVVKFLQPSPSIPKVDRTEMIDGTWFEAGAKRRVIFEDGNTAVERVIAYEPEVFRYQIWGFTAPSRYLIDHVEGEIKYEKSGETDTRFIWTYKMKPRAFFTTPLLERFMENDYAPFMKSGLEEMRKAAVLAKAKQG